MAAAHGGRCLFGVVDQRNDDAYRAAVDGSDDAIRRGSFDLEVVDPS